MELYLAAHPQDARNLILTATHMLTGEEGFVEAFLTSDGGNAWVASQLPQLRDIVVRKETDGPVVDSSAAYASNGALYCAMVAPMRRGHAWGRLAILVYRSRDQGASWEGPTALGPFFDRPAMITTGAGSDSRLFIAAMGVASRSDPVGVAVLRSGDDGASFQRVYLTPDNLGHNAGNPVVTPEGLLIVPYVDYPSTVAKGLEQRLRLMRTSRIYVVASRDQGQTFGLARIVAEAPALSAGLPVAAIDLSRGKFRGRVYLAWNGEGGGRKNVVVAHSDDSGEKWSATAIRAPDAGPSHFSSVAVSNNGTLGVAWIQHAAEASRKNCWRAYFAASVDGGERFSAPVAVSSALSCPELKANFNQTRHPFEHGGDYVGLAAAADGAFHVAWPDCRHGRFQVYTARITVRGE